jgi:hypothetical protein
MRYRVSRKKTKEKHTISLSPLNKHNVHYKQQTTHNTQHTIQHQPKGLSFSQNEVKTVAAVQAVVANKRTNTSDRQTDCYHLCNLLLFIHLFTKTGTWGT